MATPKRTGHRGAAHDDSLRRRFILLAGVAAVLALLHFADHVIRGELVVDGGLNPDWNHSGWPFNTHADEPYIFAISFVVVFGLFLGGILFTVRDRLWAGYWLATSMALIALLGFIHFVGASKGSAETPSVIAMTYHNRVSSVLALIVLFGLVAVLITLGLQAVRTRRGSGHW